MFPRRLEEFLQERYHDGHRIVNPLRHSEWEGSYAFAQELFEEDIETMDRAIREITTRRLAYELWERRGRPLWDDQTDWLQAERILGFSN